MSDARCPPFTRCADANGQWRSICMGCFLTVATAGIEDQLRQGEGAHDCDQFFTPKRTSMSVELTEYDLARHRASGC